MAHPFRLQGLNTQLDIDASRAEKNALVNQQLRQRSQAGANQLANAPAERNYLLQQRANEATDRANALADADYTRGRRPAAELGQEADILKKVINTSSYEQFLQMLPELRQRLPTVASKLPDRQAWEAKSAEAGMSPEAFYEQSKPGAGVGKNQWTNPQSGTDEQGNPVIYRVNKKTGEPEIIKGIRPTPKKGMKVYGPDGKVIFETGGDADLTKKTKGRIEGKLIDGSEQLARMNAIYSEYKPEYQEVGTRFKAAWTGTKAFLGIPVEEKDRLLLVEFSKFRRKAIENINLYIKELTGAQMSEKEADRLRLAQPDPGENWYRGDDPITFKAKMDDVIKTTRAAVARWKYYKSMNYTDAKIKNIVNKGDALDLDAMATRME